MASSVAILGSAGYTGQETLDRVLAHPGLELVALGSDSLAGRPAQALDPRLNGAVPMFTSNVEAGAERRRRDLPLPRERAGGGVRAARERGRRRPRRRSPAHRSRLWREKWYGLVPGAWSYGLPEVHSAEGPLIANPGCYATATLLALWPLRDAIEGDVVVDAKSGMTGAGKMLRDRSHAGAVLENFAPYAVGGHRHAPEIAQVLGLPITFVPHLLPVRRGLLSTCYLRSSADVRGLIEAAYAGSQVVRVLPEGVEPEIGRVQGTDAAEIGVFSDPETGMEIVICAIDNLGKGAAGQAVQNVNLALGLAETTGLRLGGVLV